MSRPTKKLLKPNQDMYQEWAEQVLTIVKEKHGNFANYLKAKEIPAIDVEIPEALSKKNEPAEYAKWEVKMKIIVAHQLSIEDTSPNVIELI
jgi:hypothetical protein